MTQSFMLVAIAGATDAGQDSGPASALRTAQGFRDALKRAPLSSRGMGMQRTSPGERRAGLPKGSFVLQQKPY